MVSSIHPKLRLLRASPAILDKLSVVWASVTGHTQSAKQSIIPRNSSLKPRVESLNLDYGEFGNWIWCQSPEVQTVGIFSSSWQALNSLRKCGFGRSFLLCMWLLTILCSTTIIVMRTAWTYYTWFDVKHSPKTLESLTTDPRQARNILSKCGFGSSHSCASAPFSTQLISSGQHIRPLCNLGSLIRGFDVKLSSKLKFLRASGTIFDKLSVVWACVSHWALLKWDTFQGGNGTSTIPN